MIRLRFLYLAIVFFIVGLIGFVNASHGDTICTTQYDPVCGEDNNTYSNECFADNSHIVVSCEGECPCELDCKDGIISGECGDPPLYCDDGKLVSKCSVCGCPEDELCRTNGECDRKKIDCKDGTINGSCSVDKPSYCSEGLLIDNCSECGCPIDQSCQENGRCQVVEAFFRFDYRPSPETFVIRLTDEEKINEARDILSNKTRKHIMGKIVKEHTDYNEPWSFYLNESTIIFFENAIEVCDASILYLEEHIDDACGAFLPDCRWCPWGSKLIEEVDDKGVKIFEDKRVEEQPENGDYRRVNLLTKIIDWLKSLFG